MAITPALDRIPHLQSFLEQCPLYTTKNYFELKRP